ncbi:MAG: hypothetical protein ACXWCZ_07030 [Flavisolibacter sp.]
MLLKNELQSIISGTGHFTKGAAIQAVAGYHRKSKSTDSNPEKRVHQRAGNIGNLRIYMPGPTIS